MSGGVGGIPNGEAGKGSTSQEHADIHRPGLDSRANRHNDAHHLHEANAAHLIGDGGLKESTNGFSRNVYGHNLNVALGETLQMDVDGETYRPSHSLGGIAHVVNPALVSDG